MDDGSYSTDAALCRNDDRDISLDDGYCTDTDLHADLRQHLDDGSYSMDAALHLDKEHDLHLEDGNFTDAELHQHSDDGSYSMDEALHRKDAHVISLDNGNYSDADLYRRNGQTHEDGYSTDTNPCRDAGLHYDNDNSSCDVTTTFSALLAYDDTDDGEAPGYVFQFPVILN